MSFTAGKTKKGWSSKMLQIGSTLVKVNYIIDKYGGFSIVVESNDFWLYAPHDWSWETIQNKLGKELGIKSNSNYILLEGEDKLLIGIKC